VQLTDCAVKRGKRQEDGLGSHSRFVIDAEAQKYVLASASGCAVTSVLLRWSAGPPLRVRAETREALT